MIGGILSGIVTNGMVGNFQSMILLNFASLFEITITPIPSNISGQSAGATDFVPVVSYNLAITLSIKNIQYKSNYVISNRTAQILLKNLKYIKTTYSVMITQPIEKIIKFIVRPK